MALIFSLVFTLVQVLALTFRQITAGPLAGEWNYI